MSCELGKKLVSTVYDGRTSMEKDIAEVDTFTMACHWRGSGLDLAEEIQTRKYEDILPYTKIKIYLFTREHQILSVSPTIRYIKCLFEQKVRLLLSDFDMFNMHRKLRCIQLLTSL